MLGVKNATFFFVLFYFLIRCVAECYVYSKIDDEKASTTILVAV